MTTATHQARAIVHAVNIHHGIAGQLSAIAVHQYPSGTLPQHTVFRSSLQGGPVFMSHREFRDVRIDSPERFGEFSTDPEAWVRRFFEAT